MKKAIDHVVLWVLCLVALLPTSRLSVLGRSYQVEAPLALILAGLLVLRIGAGGLTRYSGPLIAFIVLCGTYVLASAVLVGSDGIAILQHLVTLFPFFVACLALAVKSTLKIEQVLRAICVCLGISAILHLYIYIYNPVFFVAAARDQSTAENVVNWGRLNWLGAALTLVIPIAWFAIPNQTVKWKIVFALCWIFAVLALITGFSRTLIFAVIVQIVAGLLILVREKKTASVISAVIVLVLSIGATGWIGTKSQTASALIQYRILGNGGRGQISDSDISARTGLYDQYQARLSSGWTLAIGQGLGESFTNTPNVYWADVSFITLLLPFGILGLSIFGWLCISIWKALDSADRTPLRTVARGLKFVFVLGILVSLNDNIMVGKCFVYFISIFASTVHSQAGRWVTQELAGERY